MLFWRRRSEQRALSELNLELGSEEGIAQVLRWQAAHARRRRSVQLDSLEQRREGGQGQVQRQHRGLAQEGLEILRLLGDEGEEERKVGATRFLWKVYMWSPAS